MVIEAMILLLISKTALIFLPFSWISKLMGTIETESSFTQTLGKHDLKLIRQSIVIADKNIPIETSCYPQALTGKIMLSYRRHRSTVYLGILKSQKGPLMGHAWLRHGDFIVTGKNRIKEYQVITTYS